MKKSIPVIDMWAPIVPSREIMEYVADHFPEPQLGYLRVFFKTDSTLGAFKKLALDMVSDDEAVLASLDEANIRMALITGFDEAISIPRSSRGLYGIMRSPSIPQEAETISFGFASSIRVASSCGANPPKTTE